MWWACSSVSLADLVESYTSAVRVTENWNRLPQGGCGVSTVGAIQK